MRRNPSPRRTALRITHRTVAIVAGLSLISGGIAGAATVAITAPAQAQEQTTGVQGQPNSTGTQDGGMQGGASTMTFDYTGSYAGALAADGEAISSSGETLTATVSDQNAALVQNGGSLTLEGALLQKSGNDTDGDRCNFYGVNSILTAVGEGSSATVSNSSLAATSAGSNGIFATDGATVKVSDTSIDTTADNSRGLDATYGGVITADNVDITTAGDHCAGSGRRPRRWNHHGSRFQCVHAGLRLTHPLLHRRYRSREPHRHGIRQSDCRHGGPQHHRDR